MGDVHGGLSDPVHVHQGRLILRVLLVPRVEPARCQRLAAEDDVAQVEPCAGALLIGLDQLVERGRRLIEDRDALFCQ